MQLYGSHLLRTRTWLQGSSSQGSQRHLKVSRHLLRSHEPLYDLKSCRWSVLGIHSVRRSTSFRYRCYRGRIWRRTRRSNLLSRGIRHFLLLESNSARSWCYWSKRFPWKDLYRWFRYWWRYPSCNQSSQEYFRRGAHCKKYWSWYH